MQLSLIDPAPLAVLSGHASDCGKWLIPRNVLIITTKVAGFRFKQS
jgi:hypothetical protein